MGIALSLCASIPGIAGERLTGKSRTNAPVFKKLFKGVNADTAGPDRGGWPKVQHDAAHFQAVADAGFDSVRVFLPVHANYESTERQINDALSNGLAIVVCMWGSAEWSLNPGLGERQIADRWAQLARAWKKYPGDLVFEILNEPEGVGFVGSGGRQK